VWAEFLLNDGGASVKTGTKSDLLQNGLLMMVSTSVLLFGTLSAQIAIAPVDATIQWQAHWIAARPDLSTMVNADRAPNKAASVSLPLPIFRHQFSISAKVAKATLYISGLGQFEAHINGINVTNDVLTPGWTDYRKRVFYDTYDVTNLIGKGQNAIGVMLGNGMYNVQQTPGRYTKFTGSMGQPKLILQLLLRFADGSQQTILSDGKWKTASGPITFSSIYGGEDYDARLEQPDWDKPHFDASGWSNVEVVQGPAGKLVPETIPPVKAFDSYEPITVTHPRPSISVYDLGQNFAGWPEIEVSGLRGAQIKIIAGELLDKNGLVTQRSANALPNSQSSFNYVLSGQGLEKWHPRFTYYGFRYVQVEQTPVQSAVIHYLDGRFLHSAVSVDGTFTSSDQLFNRIHTLINRAMLSNIFSVLTDCPHREKLGWIEQTHLAGASLMYNYDLSAAYAKLADDMQDAQLPNGLIPDIAPEYTVFQGAFRDSPEWGVAVVLSTWNAYQFYGDLDVLRKHYDSMARYVAYLQGRSQNHLLAYGLGDWYDIGPRAPGESQLTAKGITSTAIYYQTLEAMSHIAILLRKPQDTAKYSKEGKEVKKAFNTHFFQPKTNQYDRGSQTSDAMPLVVGLVPKGREKAVLKNLIADIRKHSNHVTAGDIGFHYVVRALTDNGRSDVLYDVLSRTDKPSYGDQLAHGATTLTEAWDANPNSSQNHFMLGHAEEWLYRGLAGIDFNLTRDIDSRIRINPAIIGDIQSTMATFNSKLGRIESGWVRNGDMLLMNVTIPENATATIVFPVGYNKSIRVRGHPLKIGEGIHSIQRGDAQISCIVGGGRYQFEALKSQPVTNNHSGLIGPGNRVKHLP
jgi:alpha-L-rhamnosidase